MTIIACVLAVALVVLYFAQTRQVNTLTREAARERAKLLDRIQHPELRQVEPGERTEYEPPKDTAELAYVGQEVPEFIQVGTTGAENGAG
jgi:hypothetical protein